MSIPSVIADSVKVPGTYIQLSLGVGTRNPGDLPIKLLLYGNKTSAGTIAVDTPTRVLTPEDAATLCGAGSELHLMCLMAFAAYKLVDLTVIAVTESAGTAASETIAFSGTATADGTITVWVGRWGKVVIPVSSGQANTVVSVAVEAAIDAMTNWPVTASETTGTVTVTAKHKGPRGNYIAIRALQEGAAGITMTPPSGSYLSGGTTMDDPTNSLAAVAPLHYRFHVTPYQTATELALYKTHVNTYAAPLEGKRQRFVYGSIDTLGNSTTLSDTINEARSEMAWHYNALSTPGEIAADYAALLSDYLGRDRAYNTDDLVVPELVPQIADADQPTETEKQAALDAGITPLYASQGVVRICRRVTGYHLDSGSNPDYSILDGHKVDVADFIADDLQGSFFSFFKSPKIGDDVEGEDPPKGTVTPDMAEEWVYSMLKDHEEEGILYWGSVDEFRDEIAAQVDPIVSGRMNFTVPIKVADLLHQGSFDLRQVG